MRQRLCEESSSEEDDTSETQPTIICTEDEATQVFPVFYSPRTSLPTAAILEVTRRYETEAV